MPAKRQLVAAVFAVACLGTEIVGAGVALAQETPPAGASIDKVGWWNASRGPQPGEPDNPLRPALAPVPAPPTNVPADALGVGAAGGEATKVAAVGILVDATPGATASTLTLTVKESPAPGANLAADQAAIVACPITGFWGETRNGDWIDRPTADCTLATAKGTRSADGTWTFDLAAMAPLWLDPAGPGQNGVLLTEAVDAPGGFEASFLDPSAGGMTLAFAADGGTAAATDESGTGAASTVSDGFALAPVDTGAADLGRTDPFSLAPSPATPSARSGSGAPAASTSAPTAGRAAVARARPTGPRAGDLVGNVSPATLLLIPAALVLALILSLALGDAAPASVGATANGGVSRALARRERAGLLSPDA